MKEELKIIKWSFVFMFYLGKFYIESWIEHTFLGEDKPDYIRYQREF